MDIEDLGRSRYFLEFEVADSNKHTFISQQKYVLDLTNGPIEQNHRLMDDKDEAVVGWGITAD